MKYILLILMIITSINATEVAVATTESGSVLDRGMILITKNNSSVTLVFKDNSVLALGSNSPLFSCKYAG